MPGRFSVHWVVPGWGHRSGKDGRGARFSINNLPRCLVAKSANNPQVQESYGSGHLMCSTSLWGVAGFIGCAYFAWVSFRHVAQNEFEWPHDLWTAGTYVVWIALLGGLAYGTHCLRERFFFGALLINFVIGLVLTLWSEVPADDVRTARFLTGALWALAAVMSLTTVGRAERAISK